MDRCLVKEGIGRGGDRIAGIAPVRFVTPTFNRVLCVDLRSFISDHTKVPTISFLVRSTSRVQHCLEWKVEFIERQFTSDRFVNQ